MLRRTWLLGALAAASLVTAACGDTRGSAASPNAVATVPQTAAGAAGAAAPATPAAQAPAAAPAAPSPAKLNLNTATREQFLTVPGVGDRMVREFLEYRPYRSLQQFRREIGKYVSPEQVAAYERYVFVPVDPNAADAETLRQLPGVDATVAAQLVAGRPYASPEAFLARLGQHVGPEQASAARAYLATA